MGEEATEITRKGLENIITGEVVELINMVPKRNRTVFFTKLAIGKAEAREFPQDVVGLLEDPRIKDALQDFIGYMFDKGYFRRLLLYVYYLSGDWEISYEFVQLALWRTFLTYDWINYPVNGDSAFAFAKRSCRFLFLRFKESSDIYSSTVGIYCDDDTGYVEMMSGVHGRPVEDEALGNVFLEKQIELAVRLVMGRVKKYSEDQVRGAFLLLCNGASIKDASVMVRVPSKAVARWARVARGVFGPVDEGQRIKTKTDGNWKWNGDTARSILGNRFLKGLLTPEEVRVLEMISNGYSFGNVAKELCMNEETLRGLLTNIRAKCKSMGERTRYGGSRYGGRRNKIAFLRGIDLSCLPWELRQIVEALIKTGNEYEAAKILGTSRGEISRALSTLGYYRG